MRKIFKIVAISIYAAGAGLAVFFLLPQTGWKALNVATGSMSPAVPAGSLIIIHNDPLTQLKIGDIVTYKNPQNLSQTITHRVVEQKNQGNIPGFVTKGDANATPDRPIVGGHIVGRVIWSVPSAGRVLAIMHSWPAIILFVILPGIIVIIYELKRLVGVLTQYSYPTRPTPPQLVRQSIANPRVQRPRRRPRRMDGLSLLILAFCAITLTSSTTLGALTTTAQLTNNTIATATKSNHLVISRVSLANGVAACGGSSSISITNTGPGSTNTASITSICSSVRNSHTNVNVPNQSNQTATSGNVSVNNSTSGQSATSGSVNNTGSANTNVTVNNTPVSTSAITQSLLLHNPTAAAILLAGWTVTDNGGIAQTLPNTTIAVGGSAAFAMAIGNGLSGAGDRLILKNDLGQTIDSLSWGSDTTVLDPAIVAITASQAIRRVNPSFDTDQATDWTIEP